MEYDLHDLLEFVLSILPLWHDKAKQRGNLEEVHPVMFACFEKLISNLLAGKPVALPDVLLPEYGQDARSWLYTVGRNAIKDRIRDERTWRRYEHKAALQPNHYAFCGRSARSAESVWQAQEAERDLLAAIDRLPPNLREVMELVYDGCDFGEIAEKLGVHRNTVHHRLISIRSPRIRRLIMDAMVAQYEPYTHIKNPLVRPSVRY